MAQEKIEFSDLISISGSLGKFSPSGQFFALVYANKIVIRKSETLENITILTAVDKVQFFEWSSDSTLILAGMPSRNRVQIFKLDDPKEIFAKSRLKIVQWTCSIDSGVLGIDWATFSPDGRHVIASSEFNINYTVFSLIDKSIKTIENPKNAQQNLKFSLDGSFAFVGERKQFQDAISVIRLSDWKMEERFETETQDFKSIQLNKLGAVIALNDPLPRPQIVLYSILGKKLAAIPNGLGCFWSPTSQFLAVRNATDCDIYNHITWTRICSLSPLVDKAGVVYEEKNNNFIISQEKYLAYIANDECPAISKVQFSPENTYVSLVQGQAVQIYSIKTMKLSSVIFLKTNVKTLNWAPRGDRLVLTTGTSNLYLWTQEGCMVIRIPHSEFLARSLIWAPAGDSAVLFAKNQCALTYFSTRENLPKPSVQSKKDSKTKSDIDSRLKDLNIINA